VCWFRRSSALTALALAVFLAVGCGGTELDAAATEDQVAKSAEESRGEKVSSVDCPSGVEVEPGAKFSCTVRLSDGKTATATLKIRDEDANLDFVHLGPSK
jgi:NAD(P)H-hydrate repair Nnr-like enzyme with NAD(P)H-hydrate epimerase domain